MPIHDTCNNVEATQVENIDFETKLGGGGNVKELQPWHVPQGKATHALKH